MMLAIAHRKAVDQAQIGFHQGGLTVGATLFESSLKALRPGGILSLVGAVGGSEVRFDLWNLIRPMTLTGYSSETLDGPALRHAVTALTGWVQDGSMTAPRYTTVPLAEAARAHTIA